MTSLRQQWKASHVVVQGVDRCAGAARGLHGLDDPSLDDRTAALSRRGEALLAESHELDEALARTTKALKDARGEGEAEAGAVG